MGALAALIGRQIGSARRVDIFNRRASGCRH
jgi:hypothetical protein